MIRTFNLQSKTHFDEGKKETRNDLVSGVLKQQYVKYQFSKIFLIEVLKIAFFVAACVHITSFGFLALLALWLLRVDSNLLNSQFFCK